MATSIDFWVVSLFVLLSYVISGGWTLQHSPQISRSKRTFAHIPSLSSSKKKELVTIVTRNFCSSQPGAEILPGTEKYDVAIRKFANSGEWNKAQILIENMREKEISPSMDAYSETIVAMRRSLEFCRADALMMDMFNACMPQDLFEKYAAPDPNDASYSQTQRVFALLLYMRKDDLEPDVDTYRAVMGLCTKERQWHLSLLLLEHMRLRGVQPGKFIYNEICTVLESEGKQDLAEMVYEQSLSEGVFEPWIDDKKIDLHTYTVNTARAAVRSALIDMLRQPDNRGYHKLYNPLHIVTGVGKRSEEGVAVIKPAILQMLNSEMAIPAMVQAHNQGCVEVFPQYLQAWARARISSAKRSNDPHFKSLLESISSLNSNMFEVSSAPINKLQNTREETSVSTE